MMRKERVVVICCISASKAVDSLNIEKKTVFYLIKTEHFLGFNFFNEVIKLYADG